MIPRNPDRPIRHEDKKSGVAYLLKYLIDEDQEQFDDVAGYYSAAQKETDEKKKLALLTKYHRGMVNLFLAGWESLGDVKLDPFPTDGNPARYFVGSSIYGISRIIDSHIGELIGVDTNDAQG